MPLGGHPDRFVLMKIKRAFCKPCLSGSVVLEDVNEGVQQASNALPDGTATGVGCIGKLSKLGHLEEPAYYFVVSHRTNQIKGEEEEESSRWQI
jgi:hypothetical protein